MMINRSRTIRPGITAIACGGLLCAAALSGCASDPVATPQDAPPTVHRVAATDPGPWTPEPGREQGRPRANAGQDTPGPAAEVVHAAPARVPGSRPRHDRQSRPGEAAISAQPEPDDIESADTQRPPIIPPVAARSEVQPQPVVKPKPLHAAWLAESAYNQRYDASPDAEVQVRAVVEAVETFVPANGAEPGLALRVTAAGQESVVHVGPLRYLRDLGVRFNYRDELTLVGTRATINGGSVLLARQIRRGDTAVDFRDAETGRPLWDHQATE